MTSSYKVLAPYVTTKVKDVSGQHVVMGYYRDGLIQNPADQDHVDALVNLGMLEEADAPVVETEEPADESPKGNASREEWAVYAKDKKGAPDEETRPVEEGGLKQTELREKYGN
jgi:hypothetical protein